MSILSPFLRRKLRALVPKGSRLWKVYGVLGIVFVSLGYYLIISPPLNFPLRKTIRIEEGMTLKQIALRLKEAGVIRSQTVFASMVTLSGKEENLVAGQYRFDRPYSLFTVIKRLITGTFGFHMVKVVIPEGATNAEITTLLDKQLPSFDREKFFAMVEGKEGHLFPDTYYFTPVATELDAFTQLEKNFKRRVGRYEVESLVTGHSFHEILTMASLLEEEAKTDEDRTMISSILWNRIEEGMPLQVDAVFPYIIGRNTYQVTKVDLANKSPYNTYVHKGLPPGPISNPGLSSIRAAINPTQSDYFFYLHDRRGTMHYARTFDEHVANRRKYLN